MDLQMFLKKFVALFLVFPMLTMSLVQAKTPEAKLLNHIQQEYLKEQVVEVKAKFESIKSWDDLKLEVERSPVTEDSKKKVLTEIDQMAKEPFVKPVFTIESHGFSISFQGEKATFDLVKNELIHKKRTFPLEGKTPEELMEWLKGEKKFSFLSIIIPEAHAIVPLFFPLFIGAMFIVIAVSSAHECKKKFKKMSKKIPDSLGTCESDLHSKDISLNSKLLLIAVKGSTVMEMIPEPKWNRFNNCEEVVTHYFTQSNRYCGDKGSQDRICEQLNELDKCLKNLEKISVETNKSGREIIIEKTRGSKVISPGAKSGATQQ